MDMSMGMSSTFQTSTSTPLYSTAWTPRGTGGYAGTCIFLIILATLLRGLFAFKHTLEQRWLDRERNRRLVVVKGQPSTAGAVDAHPGAKTGTLITATSSDQSTQEAVRIVRSDVRKVVPWRFSTDLPRALLWTVIAGGSYLLMLAVMTFNVGYFLSVLAGTFVGELAFGRYITADEH